MAPSTVASTSGRAPAEQIAAEAARHLNDDLRIAAAQTPVRLRCGSDRRLQQRNTGNR